MDKDRVCVKCGAALADAWRGELCPACSPVLARTFAPQAGPLSADLSTGQESTQPNSTAEKGSQKATKPVAQALMEMAGSQIGRYKILQQLGEGGCGVVYLGEQEVPVRRRVALKIVKPGMDTREVLARFEAERQALALMDHPNISKVLDAGATDGGRPFFVMELVQGVKITEYCDRNNLVTRERLEIFIQVCKAVQHAHQKGIIHRDLKPSNILVTLQDGVAVPKVIDFGIAKATAGQKLTDRTLFTALEQFIGTPAYMSPEQAQLSGLDIDTRSDIYSLGVLLYELLTGKTPFDPRRLLEAGLEGIRRIIGEEEPPRPSTKLSTLAAEEQTTTAKRHQTNAPRLIRLVRGDLDWIVMKCLEKDRGRRYETANGLARDLERYLNDEPVVATPPTASYRLRKFIRAHKMAVGTAGVIALVLVIGSIVSARFYLRERIERENAQRAQREAEHQGKIARQTSDFLTTMFSSIDPAEAKQRDITVREVLDEADRTIGGSFPGEPLTELPIRETLAEIYRKIGKSDQALAETEAALRLARAAHGQQDHRDVAQCLDNLALCLDDLGRANDALPKYEEAVSVWKRLDKGDNIDVAVSLEGLGTCLQTLGRFREAFGYLESALEMKRRIIKGDNVELAKSLNNVASCQDALARSAEALTNREATLAMLQRIHPGDHPDVAQAMNGLGFNLDKLGRYSEALKVHEEALAMRHRLYRGDHPDTAYSLNNVGLCLDHLGRSSEALTNFQAALEMRQRMFKADHPSVALSLNNMGFCLGRLNRQAEAMTNYQASLQMYQRIYKGDDNPAVARGLNNVAFCLDSLGRPAEALPKFREALAMRKRIYGNKDHNEIANGLNNIGFCLSHLGEFAEAWTNYQEAVGMDQRIYPKDHPDTATSLNNAGRCLTALGRPAEALPLHEQALAMRQRIYHGDHSDIADDMGNLGLCLVQLGRPQEALAKFEQALAMWRRIHKQQHPGVAYGLLGVGSCLDSLGRPEEAIQNFEAAEKILEELLPQMPGSILTQIRLAETLQKTGDTLCEIGKAAEAQERYHRGLNIVESLLSMQVSNAVVQRLQFHFRVVLHQDASEVVISDIVPNGQAERLGVLKGDALVRYNQHAVGFSEELTRLVAMADKPQVRLQIRRGGNPMEVVAAKGPLGIVCEDRSVPNTAVK